MPVTHVRIENYKSIKRCDIDLNDITALIGPNGTGKTNILDAISYFYNNLTEENISDDIYDANNKFCNQAKITLTFDISNFVLISKTQASEWELLFGDCAGKSRYGEYFKSIYSLISSNKEKTISIQLSQIKGKGIQWSEPYQRRIIVKSLFPFFYIDARNLDINEWSQVWSILGELAKVSNSEKKSLEKQIREVIESNCEMANKVKAIRTIFELSELSVEPEASKEFASSLSKIYFSGKKIYQRGRNLKYFSAGTNSVKYIELLLRAINEIARNKMKEPVILIDEPEISLHPNYIDELADIITAMDNKLRMVISSHSSRLIKKLMPYERMVLYNVKFNNRYTVIGLMKKFQQYSTPSKYRVTDDHINSYFSKGILFVEGETELELFSNPYLQILFPQLKNIDIFQAMTQEPILNIMSPKKNKSKIPYICLIDADKAIRFNNSTGKLELIKEYFNNPKEKFRFKNKKEQSNYIYHLHLRILNMVNKLRVHYYKPFFSCNDPNYDTFKKAVHEYLLYYSTFTLDTTIEGSLINKRNYSYALEYLEKNTSTRDFTSFINFLNSQKSADKMNIIRLIFNGKTDLLKKYDGKNGVKNVLPNSTSLVLDKVMIGKKTSGWVSDYIDCFFAQNMPPEQEKTPKVMRQIIKSDKTKLTFYKELFECYFPELYSLFSHLNKMLS